MKKMIPMFFVAIMALSVAALPGVLYGQEVAMTVSWYAFPCSLPNNEKSVDFGTARDNLLTGLVMGGPLDTGSRVGAPTGIEIKDVFDAGDVSVATNVTLWRGVFNPVAPYDKQYGQRVYCPVMIVGRDGKVSVSRLQYKVFSGVGLLANQSSLAALGYSVSRIGVKAGADGTLFTPDDVIVKSGPGTELMDAVVFIGARAGANVTGPEQVDNLNREIGTNGTHVTFQYEYVSPDGILTKSFTVRLHQAGTIPDSFSRIVCFPGPKGILFSVVGPPASVPMVMLSARRVDGSWSTAVPNAVEGSSTFMYFTWTADDQGYCRLVPSP